MGVFSENAIIGASNASGYDIEQSLRFNDGDSPILERAVSSAGNRRTSTWSAWVKIGWNTFSRDDTTIEPLYTLFSCGNSDARWNVGFSNATAINNNLPQLFIGQRDSGGSQAFEVSSNQAFRDSSTWYHIVVVMDTTQATNTNRVKAYINGERITDWGVTSWPTQNYDSDCFRTADPIVKVRVGGTNNQSNTGARFWNGYIAEVNVIDGQALLPSYFGETDAATNQWKAKEYAGTYGTNGFYQKFANTEESLAIVDSSIKTTSDVNFTTTGAITADVLVVGGGGGGGSLGGAGSGGAGAGGGAGGFRTETGIVIASGVDTAIMVGFGGGGGKSGYRMQPESVDNANSQNKWGQGHHGGPSGFGDYVVDGGGGGGSQDVGARPYGLWGEYSQSGGTFTGRVPMTGSAGGGGTEAYGTGGGAYGNNGGNYPTRPSPGAGCGGGGGAGADGGPGGTSPNSTPGNGGAGSTNAFQTGSNITYGGGGGAGRPGNGSGPAGGSGGSGGGGAGSNGGSGTQGTNGLGGGGGGGGNQSAPNGGGSGGSGVVIVRYLASSAQATGGTITTYGAGASQYYVHTFDTVNTRPTHLFILRGAVKQTDAQSKVGNSSFYFDGTTGTQISAVTQVKQISGTSSTSDDFLHATDTAFCYEYWVKPTDVSGSHYHLSNYCLSSAGGGSGDGNNVELGIYTSGTDLRVRIDDTDRITGVATVAANTWYHVAVSRAATTGVITLYLDGVAKGTYTADQTIGNTRSSLFVGSRYKSAAGGSAIDEFDGYIDELIISNVERHSSNFTPSTTLFTADANTLVLLQSNFGGGLGADSSGNKNGFDITNLAATDQMIDTPQNSTGGNFCTLNPLDGNGTYSEGNLKVVTPA